VVAREGADRFVALLPLAIKEDASAVAERVRATIERMCFEVEQGRFQLTIRVGCATRSGREELNSILGRADSACRDGRRQGGNVVSSD
jgi:diguanylate cyclase (GGDEF)-like protein